MFSSIDTDLIFKLLLNTLSVSLVIFGCYLHGTPKNKTESRDYATSFLLFATGVFIVTYLLHSADISMGFAFGLFAVFSMLRYRTESISIKEMTYLFLVIAMSLLSAVGSTSILELLLLHSIFIVCAFFCETIINKKVLLEQTIQYEKIENITPKNRDILIHDIKNRTGLNIQDFKIINIDFLRDCANIIVFYIPQEAENSKDTASK